MPKFYIITFILYNVYLHVNSVYSSIWYVAKLISAPADLQNFLSHTSSGYIPE